MREGCDAVRVLGVDPGLTRCGIGVVESGEGRSVSFVDVGVVRSGTDLALERRLLTVADEVERWIARHRPDVIAVERVFSQHNVRTVMGTAQASGVVALVAARAGLPVAFHTPSEVKAAVTGEGRAGKAQVTTMVTKVLGLDTPPKPADAADALALAICHCWRSPMLDRMAQARARADELAATHRARLAQAQAADDGAAPTAAAQWAAARAAAERSGGAWQASTGRPGGPAARPARGGPGGARRGTAAPGAPEAPGSVPRRTNSWKGTPR
ncbi:Crossover junction endodeoxyribonuclease RuvC [Pseudonocardia sp. Ae168_Ps1]|nr:Crossover junction endodeoxyribonuclease RuvC [Pseudonocardia sp. Ae150A_Ps1]OLL78569.1 Crossover junction endodeoxyribonuclease RuvC [Pseudonocardia sp. Ae168_Ps1]OLL87305.1 Crossover junction endodeoxyribonuclease RuvC [Pseudonocardia sp. Ae263_Ps1]OLL92665.1 Crossover junction endodeoxyribonuclease RuvC [Pseudonocardia sp. Ae356_Ps1]